jgi:hypothetical protein
MEAETTKFAVLSGTTTITSRRGETYSSPYEDLTLK